MPKYTQNNLFVKWLYFVIMKLQGLYSRLTFPNGAGKMGDMMSITPDRYDRIKSQEEEARRARNAEIRRMRASDPKYWTYERLGKHWKLTKMAISLICEKEDD